MASASTSGPNRHRRKMLADTFRTYVETSIEAFGA
jgi:hypothetical protein